VERVFPTISHVRTYFALNNAVWGALGGLSIGVAVMLRHWRWAWPIALAGPFLSVTNHIMSNHFASNRFEALGRAKVPWFYDQIRDLTSSGRLPMQVLIAGAVAVVVVEWLILRWVGKRDHMFPPLSLAHVFRLLGQSTSRAGATQLLAAERYVRLRRLVYFAGWRTKRPGGPPGVTDVDIAELSTLLARARALPDAASPVPSPPMAPSMP